MNVTSSSASRSAATVVTDVFVKVRRLFGLCVPLPLRNAFSSAIGVAECLAELLDEVVFEVEGIVIEKLLRHLHRNV